MVLRFLIPKVVLLFFKINTLLANILLYFFSSFSLTIRLVFFTFFSFLFLVALHGCAIANKGGVTTSGGIGCSSRVVNHAIRIARGVPMKSTNGIRLSNAI